MSDSSKAMRNLIIQAIAVVLAATVSPLVLIRYSPLSNSSEEILKSMTQQQVTVENIGKQFGEFRTKVEKKLESIEGKLADGQVMAERISQLERRVEKIEGP